VGQPFLKVVDPYGGKLIGSAKDVSDLVANQANARVHPAKTPVARRQPTAVDQERWAELQRCGGVDSAARMGKMVKRGEMRANEHAGFGSAGEPLLFGGQCALAAKQIKYGTS
jgi:hypothetical protein